MNRQIKVSVLIILFFADTRAGFSRNQGKNENYSQLWVDFILLKTFKNSVRYFGTVGPRYLLAEKSGWAQYELSQSAHYNVLWNIDGIAGLLLNYTQKTDTTNLYNRY